MPGDVRKKSSFRVSGAREDAAKRTLSDCRAEDRWQPLVVPAWLQGLKDKLTLTVDCQRCFTETIEMVLPRTPGRVIGLIRNALRPVTRFHRFAASRSNPVEAASSIVADRLPELMDNNRRLLRSLRYFHRSIWVVLVASYHIRSSPADSIGVRSTSPSTLDC